MILSAMPPDLSIPCLIPAFNNPTYVKGFVDQLARFTILSLVIVDNASTYPPLLSYYDDVDAGRYERVRLLRLGQNFGPKVAWQHRPLFNMLPQYFCVSDPDLQLNPKLPDDFVIGLVSVVNRYQIGKAGFALDISDRHLMSQSTFRFSDGQKKIWEMEEDYWRTPLGNDPHLDVPLYYAPIDTTFALYNKAFFDLQHPLDAIRVAGCYSCRHLPWYVDNGLPDEEAIFYRRTAEYSYYLAEKSPVQLRKLFVDQDTQAEVGPVLSNHQSSNYRKSRAG